MADYTLYGVTALLALAPIAVMLRAAVHAQQYYLLRESGRHADAGHDRADKSVRADIRCNFAARPAVARRSFPRGHACRLLHYCRQSWRSGREFICAWLRTARARAALGTAHSTALFGEKCQFFLDNLVADLPPSKIRKIRHRSSALSKNPTGSRQLLRQPRVSAFASPIYWLINVGTVVLPP